MILHAKTIFIQYFNCFLIFLKKCGEFKQQKTFYKKHQVRAKIGIKGIVFSFLKNDFEPK